MLFGLRDYSSSHKPARFAPFESLRTNEVSVPAPFLFVVSSVEPPLKLTKVLLSQT